MQKVIVKKKGKAILSVSAVTAPIDYDKLAEAIMAASEKQNQKYSVSREWMKFIIYPAFWIFAIAMGLLAAIFSIYGVVEFAHQLNLGMNVDWLKLFIGGFSLIFGLFLSGVCMSTIFAAKELDKENDRQYVATMFSNMVGLVALIVALIALVKG